jgi:RNA polymerase sigma-B factor
MTTRPAAPTPRDPHPDENPGEVIVTNERTPTLPDGAAATVPAPAGPIDAAALGDVSTDSARRGVAERSEPAEPSETSVEAASADQGAAHPADAADVVPPSDVVDPVEPVDGLDAVENEPPPSTSVGVDRERTRELFGRLVDLPQDDPARQRVRDALVEQHLPLVEHLARRFRNRGEPYDDLVQVATIGLIKSVDRFDLGRGVEFSTYATPTIVGEIKRHFRDKGWAVRVPRRLQELRLSLTAATSELSQRNGRSPTVAELAGYLKLSEEEVLEGLESANAYSTLSLDAGDSNDDDSVAVVDTLGVDDEGLEGVEYRESLKPMLEQLPARGEEDPAAPLLPRHDAVRDRREVGISQMHVSRLLARTLAQLREGLLVDE